MVILWFNELIFSYVILVQLLVMLAFLKLFADSFLIIHYLLIATLFRHMPFLCKDHKRLAFLSVNLLFFHVDSKHLVGSFYLFLWAGKFWRQLAVLLLKL